MRIKRLLKTDYSIQIRMDNKQEITSKLKFIGKLKNGDIISIEINIKQLEGLVNFVGEGKDRFDMEEGAKRLAKREIRKDISAHPELPDDTKLWAALQGVGGGTWGGCVFNVEEIVDRLRSS